jgi:hypothetical protein
MDLRSKTILSPGGHGVKKECSSLHDKFSLLTLGVMLFLKVYFLFEILKLQFPFWWKIEPIIYCDVAKSFSPTDTKSEVLAPISSSSESSCWILLCWFINTSCLLRIFFLLSSTGKLFNFLTFSKAFNSFIKISSIDDLASQVSAPSVSLTKYDFSLKFKGSFLSSTM